MSEKVIAYKGFNKDLTCTPDGVTFQYEIGKTYKLDGPVKACRSGFHACEHPLNVFSYYSPISSRFAVVELSGDIDRDGSDTKIAAAEITIKAELKLPELISRAIDYVFSRVTYEKGAQASGYQGAAQASGDQGAAQASGYQGAAQASGDQGAAQASGDQGAAQASGDQGAAQASGKFSTALAAGIEGKAKGVDGAALFLVERIADWSDRHGEIIAVWAGIVGKDGIKADTWYTLKGGKPVEI